MDVVWAILAGLLIVTGIFGSVLPILPGPPISYVGLLVLQLKSEPPFTTKFLLVWLGIVIVVSVLDYVVPVYSSKKYGASKYGLWGCTIGLIAGFWFGPFGIILGPFLGAFLGEIIDKSDSQKALKAAVGSFIGFLFSSLLKVIACCIMLYYFIQVLI